MPGTREGGLKAAATNKQTRKDFYTRIGRLGGLKSRGGGFASTTVDENGLTGHERASRAGAKGGRNSHRGPAK